MFADPEFYLYFYFRLSINGGYAVKAVISGATGAVGMALVDLLIKNNIKVTVLCRKNSSRAMRIPHSPLVTTAECSLEQMHAFIPQDDEKHDVFFHFAWAGTTGESRNDMFLQNDNVRYTLDAVKLAHRMGCDTFIGAGSQAEYGRVEGILTPSTPAFPENGYGMAKLCASQMSRVLCHKLGLRHIWTRILSVYGPYDTEKSMVMSAVIKLLKGEVPDFTAGEQKWDYLYSTDAARAFLAIAEHGRDGAVYCLGSGRAMPLKEYIHMIAAAVSDKAEVNLGAVPYAENQVMNLCADISSLTADTGFMPEVRFEDGISYTVEWAKKTFFFGR